jgi:hypothetical protein
MRMNTHEKYEFYDSDLKLSSQLDNKGNES